MIIIVLEKCAVNQGANGDVVNKCPIGKLYHRDLQLTRLDLALCNQADLARQIILKLIGTTFWICIFAICPACGKELPILGAPSIDRVSEGASL